MPKRAITAVTVEFGDGHTETWRGTGRVHNVRTPKEAQGVPVLQDSDVTYVEVVLTYDRESEPAPQGGGGA